MNASTLKQRSASAYNEVWRMLSRASGNEVRERDGLLTYFSLAPDASFNPTIAIRPLDDPALALKECESAYTERGIPFGFEIEGGLDPATQQAALDLGLLHLHSLPSMVLDPIPVFDDPPSELEIQIVDAETLEDHMLAQASGFETSIEIMRAFCHPSFPTVSDHLLGRVDGKPVTTSIVCITEGAAGIFGVSTDPQYRNRGLGRIMTAAAVARGKELGADIAYLHATAMGFPVYKKMGFKTVSTYNIYVRPAENVTPLLAGS